MFYVDASKFVGIIHIDYYSQCIEEYKLLMAIFSMALLGSYRGWKFWGGNKGENHIPSSSEPMGRFQPKVQHWYMLGGGGGGGPLQKKEGALIYREIASNAFCIDW